MPFKNATVISGFLTSTKEKQVNAVDVFPLLGHLLGTVAV